MALQFLSELLDRPPVPRPWVDVKANLPWGEPEFSERMLREHLDPTHDQASRRPAVLYAQLGWLVNTVLKPRNVRHVLDLTCGPGLWANALGRLGYTVRGIDISPAAIDYARKTARDEGLPVSFLQADIRTAALGSGYEAALWLYAEPNALKWEEFSQMLFHINEALKPGGVLIMELKPPEAMSRMAGTSWQTCQKGPFSSKPYLWLTESFWNDDDHTACTRHYIVDLATSRVKEYGISYQCYSLDELESLLPICGYTIASAYDGLTGETGLERPEWQVIIAEKKSSLNR